MVVDLYSSTILSYLRKSWLFFYKIIIYQTINHGGNNRLLMRGKYN